MINRKRVFLYSFSQSGSFLLEEISSMSEESIDDKASCDIVNR